MKATVIVNCLISWSEHCKLIQCINDRGYNNGIPLYIKEKMKGPSYSWQIKEVKVFKNSTHIVYTYYE